MIGPERIDHDADGCLGHESGPDEAEWILAHTDHREQRSRYLADLDRSGEHVEHDEQEVRHTLSPKLSRPTASPYRSHELYS